MSFYKQMLATAVKGLTSDQFFKDVLKAVADAEGTGLSGSEKKQQVLKDLEQAGKDIAIPLINLAIEVGVLFITSKAPVVAPLVQAIGTSATSTVDAFISKQ